MGDVQGQGGQRRGEEGSGLGEAEGDNEGPGQSEQQTELQNGSKAMCGLGCKIGRHGSMLVEIKR